jgi:hypothetical protein
MLQFIEALDEGGLADMIIESLRPGFDKAAAQLAECAELTNPGAEPETFLAATVELRAEATLRCLRFRRRRTTRGPRRLPTIGGTGDLRKSRRKPGFTHLAAAILTAATEEQQWVTRATPQTNQSIRQPRQKQARTKHTNQPTAPTKPPITPTAAPRNFENKPKKCTAQPGPSAKNSPHEQPPTD